MSGHEETSAEKQIRELKLQQQMIQEQIDALEMEAHFVKTVQEAVKTQEDPI